MLRLDIIATFPGLGLGVEPFLQNANGIEHHTAFSLADTNRWDLAIFGDLPERTVAERALAASRGSSGGVESG